MALFSDAEIEDLISCPKEIAEPPAKALRLIGAYWRNSARMIATDGTKGTFAMFMRKNEDFPENFSVGVRYNANDGRPEITLLRCNGKHGEFMGVGDAAHWHWGFHIHKASAATQDAGFAAERYGAITNEFASYEQAVEYFVKTVNLKPQNALEYFSNNAQLNFFVT